LEDRLAPAAHDTLATALPLPFDGNLQAQASASLPDPNQVDLYRVQLNAGDLVTAQVTAYSPSNLLDSGLRVFDASGRQLAFNDNRDGFDPRLTVTVPGDGLYYVGVSSAQDFGYDPHTSGSGSGGNSTGNYLLSLARTPANATGQNDTIQTADVINANAHVHGTLGVNDTEYFKLTVTGTGRLTVSVAPSDGQVLLPRLVLDGDAGQLLIESDATAANPTAQLLQHLKPGTYYLAVSAVAPAPGLAGDRGYVLDAVFDPAWPLFQSVPVGNQPRSVAVGQFTHDGNLDLVTANYEDDTVSVLLGLGDGSFLPTAPLSVGGEPASVVVADFNHDGNLDIATANSEDDTVSVLLGRGDGTFQPADPAHTFPVGDSPYAVAVGQFTHDGNLDLVTANEEDDTVSVLLGRGDGTFQPADPAHTFPVGSSPQFVAVGDFDGDGNLDVVTANQEDNTVSVLLGRGDGTFSPAVSYPLKMGSKPSAVVVGDFRNDGKIDIATANDGDNTVSVLLGNGDGTFQPAVSYAVGGQPLSLTVGYFNHKYLDLATANSYGNSVSVLLGRGDGTFQLAASPLVGSAPYAVAAGDFDGNPDLVTANEGDNTVSVLLGRGDGSFLSVAVYPAGSGPQSVAVGDFDHDGNPDLVTANYGDNTVSVLLGLGNGSFLPAASYPVGVGPYAVAVGDFNHDGNPDLVTANYDKNDPTDNTVSVLLGRGDGTFLPAVSYHLENGSQPYAVAVGDFDGDGNLDLVTANYGVHAVSVLLGNGDGTFQPAVSYPLDSGSHPDAIAVGDFNGDGIPDLVTANSGNNTVSVLLGKGDGTFRAAVSYPVGSQPQSVAVGDFNNDGRLDLATANFGDNTVSVLTGEGDGTFQRPFPLPAGSQPYAVAVGDFNRDGYADLAVASSGNKEVAVLLNRGVGPDGATFQLPAFYPVGNTPQSVAVGDFNNDGQPDLATANSGGNSVSVLLGQENASFQPATSENGIAVRDTPYLHDFDGDGIPDSLILDSSGRLLFRRGLPGAANHFAPPAVVSPGRTRDVTVFQTAAGWLVAAVDADSATASVYAWSAATDSFQRTATFATGQLPVRIAAADLSGHGLRGEQLKDLVVANDVDHSVTIAFASADGQYHTVITRPVGMGPSAIAFADLDGQNGPDIIVSDQVSGDVSLLFNDPTHSFSQQARYRAAGGLFDIDTSTGQQTVRSQHQTIDVAADDFTGSGRPDLVVVNRGDRSFTLLPNQGQGRFTAPQPGNTYPTSADPGQVVNFKFPGDQLPSVAILMEDLGQVWVYRNNGNGTFAPPTMIDAGNDPRGLAVATVQGKLALLVGNDFGDILTLLDNGKGGFAPDRANLDNVPLAMGTLAGTGQQYAVVADQSLDQMAMYFRIPGTDQFASPIPIDSQSQPLLAPGAVQLFTVPGDPNPYLAVANSLSNNILVYHGRGAGQFGPPTAYAVGYNPVSVTVADLNGDRVPDLLVANQGSNDVSVLIGSTDPNTSQWTATPYQRLNSGGSGPITVAVRASGTPRGPDLLVTNSDGKVVLLPGIGVDGRGSGFFQDVNPQSFDVGTAIEQALPDPTTGGIFVVRSDGGVSALNGGGFTSLFTPAAGAGVTALGEVGALLVAGLADGGVDLLSASGALLASQPTGLTNALSAVEAQFNGSDLDVTVTERGREEPVIVSFPFIPVVTELVTAPAEVQGTSLPGVSLVLIATLLPGNLAELPPANPSEGAPARGGENGAEGRVEAEVQEEGPGVEEQPTVTGGEAFRLGTDEALRQYLQGQQMSEMIEETGDVLQKVMDWFKGLPEPAAPEPGKTAEKPAEEEAPASGLSAPVLRDDHLQEALPGPAAVQAALAAWVAADRESFPDVAVPLPTAEEPWCPENHDSGSALDLEAGVAVFLAGSLLQAAQPTDIDPARAVQLRNRSAVR
jgi:hypothetical protein